MPASPDLSLTGAGRRAVRALARAARRVGHRLDRALRLPEATRESGQATVEFVILFPIFMALFLQAFEASLMLTRQLMLERSIDVVMREVRLSTGTSYRHDQLRTQVCERARILPQCDSNMIIEMIEIDDTTYDLPDAAAPCVDRTATAQAFDIDDLITLGGENRLMLVRACFVVDPVFPGVGLGLEMTRANVDGIQLVAASAFVQEPER